VSNRVWLLAAARLPGHRPRETSRDRWSARVAGINDGRPREEASLLPFPFRPRFLSRLLFSLRRDFGSPRRWLRLRRPRLSRTRGSRNSSIRAVHPLRLGGIRKVSGTRCLQRSVTDENPQGRISAAEKQVAAEAAVLARPPFRSPFDLQARLPYLLPHGLRRTR